MAQEATLKADIRGDVYDEANAKASKRGISLAQYTAAAISSYSSGLWDRFCRMVIIGLAILNGTSSVISGGMLMLTPDGSTLYMQPLLPMFQHLPFADIFFQDFFFCGMALALINGVPNLIALVLLITRKKSAYYVGLIAGLLLIMWTLVEIFVIAIPPAGSIVYGVMGIVQTISAIYLIVGSRLHPERSYL